MTMVPDNYQGPGIYRHYKGGEYEVIGLGVHEHAKEHQPDFDPNDRSQVYVIYRPLSDGSLLGKDTLAQFWLRQLSDFNRRVEVNAIYGGGSTYSSAFVPRFEKVKGEQE